MNGILIDFTLRRFERLYDKLDDAIGSQDVARIADLVAERQAVVEQLAATYANGPSIPAATPSIPEATRTRLAYREVTLRRTLTALRERLAAKFTRDQPGEDAVTLYNRGGTTP